VLDCGGGTVDITMHRVEATSPLRLCEVREPSGQMGNLKKRPPIGIEGVYDENSDYRWKKTNRIGKKHKVY
jgi:hypothetical protein